MPEARFELWREADFGHQHQRLPAPGQRLGDEVKVDLGLAAAGDAVEQERPVGAQRRTEALECALLLRAEGMLGDEARAFMTARADLS